MYFNLLLLFIYCWQINVWSDLDSDARDLLAMATLLVYISMTAEPGTENRGDSFPHILTSGHLVLNTRIFYYNQAKAT